MSSLPSRIKYAYDRLSAGVHVHMFDRDLLLPLASMPVQSFQQDRIGSGKLVGLTSSEGSPGPH
jgi:hypothetical protein